MSPFKSYSFFKLCLVLASINFELEHHKIYARNSQADARNGFNQEQFSRSSYPSNFKRFRRGYVPREESKFSKFSSFPNSGSSRIESLRSRKGSSRGGFSSRNFGGPDAHLVSSNNERVEPASRNVLSFAKKSNSVPKFGMTTRWGGTSNAKGRSKGGNSARQSVVQSPFGFSRSFNSGSSRNSQSSFGNVGNSFDSGQSFSQGFNSGKGTNSFNSFKNDGRPSGVSSFSTGGNRKQFSKQEGAFFSRGNGPSSAVDFNSANLPHIEDLTGGEIIGPLKDLNLDELTDLWNKFDSSSQTTKMPKRIVSSEDHNKIFSGNYENQQTKFDGFGNQGRNTEPYHNTGQTNTCRTQPKTPANGKLDCQRFSNCRMDCNTDYKTMNGDTRLYLVCKNNKWMANGHDITTIPNCEPICDPPCQNGGICLEPYKCICTDAWKGSTCEQSKVIKCFGKPPTVRHARMLCGNDECFARCNSDYAFGNGITKVTFNCQRGKWVNLSNISENDRICKPICDPPCMNDGLCLAPNVCQCTENFRGNQCQFPTSNCEPKKMNFNGGYTCSSIGMNFNCQLFCSEGIEFKYPPADIYTCDYSTSRWTPSKIPECDYTSRQISAGKRDVNYIGKYVMKAEPTSGVCFTWSGSHYKSFDGKVYSFDSDCPYTFIQDSVLGTFTVNLVPDENCYGIKCRRYLKIFTEGDQYTLQNSGDDEPILTYGDTTLVVPGQINGLISERVAHFVVLKMLGIGLTIKWDLKNFFVVEVSEQLWNRTSGLCGRLDGSVLNDWGYIDGTVERDFDTFLKTWQANSVQEMCTNSPKISRQCSRKDYQPATKFCSRLIDDPRFAACRSVVDVNPFIESCKWDYCHCKENPETCSCESYTAFFRECRNKGGAVENGWRSKDLCAMECSDQLVYKSCMPAIQARCDQTGSTTIPEFCAEGCDCDDGLVMDDNGKCVEPSNCQCTYQKKSYSAGDTIPNDCNTCTCMDGEWKCTEHKCGSRCSSVGDPHYTSFDGKQFDFMGQCSYYLVKGTDFSIEAENIACAGSISEKFKFPASLSPSFPSCTKSITLRIPGTIVHLKQDLHVIINGEEITKFPVWAHDIYVKKASSIFLTVYLPNGMEVWWDGQTRVYIDIPAGMRNQVAGLCGTFTDSQNDDFRSPEGDLELNPVAFANKWKTSEKCADVSLHKEVQNPCERHVQNKKVAEKYCSNLMKDAFSSCHLFVDPEPFYRNCMYDVCSCETNAKDCMCPILSSYGVECAQKGVFLHWRNTVRECGVQCTGGQVYQVCGDSCSHSCLDIASNPSCQRKCVEGCNCQEGFSLSLNGECVPISTCPCVREGREYKAGYEMLIDEEDQSYKLCKCARGNWECRKPTQFELDSPEFFSKLQLDCTGFDNETYSDCMPEEEINCLTMHLHHERQTDDLCRPGCRCSPGFVRDKESEKCIPAHSCPCHHGGKSYTEGETIIDHCNTCTCEGSLWSCTKEKCSATCTAWGSSHYKTFDGRIFDFQGMCDYMLAKGRRSISDVFEITIQNVPCGTNGVTCAKTLTLRVGSGENQEVIQFSRNKPVTDEKKLKRTIIREAGVFVIAEVTDMGLELQWDKGTRAYIILSSSWQGQRVQGLCGNYNENGLDDLRTPSGGVEVSAKIFGDSWRLQKYCPESITIKDTCELHPERKTWASEKCSILKTQVFSRCHFEVDVDPYLERCLFDSCGCDTGGDCECLCTAIAAYAQECNIQGVPVKWRTPEMCPMQCDETCEHYEPCIPTCPSETCDSYKEPPSTLCRQDACVEGCAKKPCERGSVRTNSTDKHCVPVQECESVCLVKDGEVFMEGDMVKQDDCHTCYCSKGESIYKGEPCETSTTIIIKPITRVTTPVTGQLIVTDDCRSGWSHWLNEDQPLSYRKTTDIEPIPEQIRRTNGSSAFCTRSMFADILCRTVGDHQKPDEGVTCNLIEGLQCFGSNSQRYKQCKDYELSVLCDCSLEVTTESISTAPSGIRTTPRVVVYPTEETEELVRPSCEIEGWTPWFNRHYPSELGEYETLANLRKTEAICPDHYIYDFECRPVGGGRVDSSKTSCSAKGAFCRNNRGHQYCTDYEFRVFCECRCQDGIGMEDGKIAPDKITISFADTTNVGRLNSDMPWIARVNRGDELSDSWIQVDLVDRKEITGVITQGHPKVSAFIKTFAVQVSNTGVDWREIRNPGQNYAKIFKGNSNGHESITNLFPEPVFVRYLRIVPIEHERFPALRFELTGCDIIEERTTITPIYRTEKKPYTCHDGWTEWMNSHKPSPGDWDDIENYQTLRSKYSFCDESAIIQVGCRVSVTKESLESGNQNNIVCNRNIGLQCISDSQDYCYDYEIRFYCDCSQLVPESTIQTIEISSPVPDVVDDFCIPDPTNPNEKHETDCQKFYECQTTFKGGKKVLKTCGPGTLYNPNIFVCDFPTNVYSVRPQCKDGYIHPHYTTTELPSVKYTDVRTALPQVTSPRMYNDFACPFDRYYAEYAISCNKLCIYYRHYLMQHNRCLEDDDKAPACLDYITGEACQEGYFLRNNSVCVSMSNCNCMLPNGMSAPPERTFLVSDCELCKCSENTLTCDQKRCFGKPKEFDCEEWSPWMSASTPAGEGDNESLGILRRYHPDVCLEPTNIECRLKNTHEPYNKSKQKVTCNTRTGFICLNKNNPGGCKDYETRIKCSCEVDPLTSTAEPPKPKPTLPPPLPGCEQSYWTEWFNVTHPYKKGGDYELIDVIAMQGYNICPRDYITDIECNFYKETKTQQYSYGGKGRSAKGRHTKGRPISYKSTYELVDYRESDDIYVTCSKFSGLTCVNSLQPKSKKCQDYSIRVHCECFATDVFEKEDDEYFPDEDPPYDGWPLVGEKCDADKIKKECAIPCNKACLFYKHYLQISGNCYHESDCTAACLSPEQISPCPYGQFMSDNSTCVEVQDCSCRLKSGLPVPGGMTVQVSRCERCTCEGNILSCTQEPGCFETWLEVSSRPTLEVTSSEFKWDRKTTTSKIPVRPTLGRIDAFTTPRIELLSTSMIDRVTVVKLDRTPISEISKPPTSIYDKATKPTLDYVPVTDPYGRVITTQPSRIYPVVPSIGCDEWTPWLSMRPNAQGDFQRLVDIRAQYTDLCERPANISCKIVGTNIYQDNFDQVITCSVDEGFVCRNKDNREDCFDYEVSLYCLCDKDRVREVTSPEPSVMITDRKVPCAAWSPWINDHKPWLDKGDFEYKTLQQLQQEYSFCTDGEISDIECVDARSGHDVTVNKDVRCDKSFGLSCSNDVQDNKICLDFKIRYYCTCDKTVTMRPTLIISQVTSFPTICDRPNYINLLADVPDSGFSSTSTKGSRYSPAKAARLNNNMQEMHNGGAWIPEIDNKDQYLQIDLGEVRIIYGFYIAGSSSMPNARVKSFTALSSDDYLVWNRMSTKILHGALSNTGNQLVLLPEPVEARWIRLHPVTWNIKIAMRVEVIGCSILTPSPPPKISICDDEMGLKNGKLLDNQITVSSVYLDMFDIYGKQKARLDETATQIGMSDAWRAKSKPDQFIRFNFLGPRKLSGIITQGSSMSDAFVESYTVRYSPDELTWNSIMDSVTGKEKIFSGNYDATTPVENNFERTIEAQYLELRPVDWHNGIAMRVEIQGCYQAYPKIKPEVTTTPLPTITPPSYCHQCPGLPEEFYRGCFPCDPPDMYNGRECVSALNCPCFYQNRSYKRGNVFKTSDCQECSCEADGEIVCTSMQCPKCSSEDEKSVITPTCDCICKQCPENTKLCSTSGLCLENEKWCDGIENCPDDELKCLPEPPPECPVPDCPEEWDLSLELEGDSINCPVYKCHPPERAPAIKCPQPSCAFNYDIILVPKKMGESCPKYECKAPYTTPEPRTCPPPTCQEGYDIQTSQQNNNEGCPLYECISKPNATVPCQPQSCPSGYDVVYTNDILSYCPKYKCEPVRVTTACPPANCPSGLQNMYIKSDDDEVCSQFMCVRITRPPMMITPIPSFSQCFENVLPICGPNEELYQANPHGDCPIFKCKTIGKPIPTTLQPPIGTKSVCKIIGRRFSTFDGSEFTLEPCEHILARDKVSNDWQISNLKTCNDDNLCSLSLNITMTNTALILESDFGIQWDGYNYTAEQANKIGRSLDLFTVSKVGDSIVYISMDKEIKVVWDKQSNIQIELANDLMFQVDGLCGLFTGSPVDDRTKMDGSLATTLKEFEDTWLLRDERCEQFVEKCTTEESKKSFLLCNVLNSKPFSECHDVLPVKDFLKGCVDRLCICLKENNTEEMCKCSILSSYVTACLEKKPDAKIAEWRISSKCYKECPQGEQYYDCFRSPCEKSCSNLKNSDACIDDTNGMCLPGCFCNPGLVRKENSCVAPERCGDSTCEAYGEPHFITFDHKNFTISGNCTFVVARDVDPTGKHQFQILATVEQCQVTSSSMCTKKLQIMTGDNREVEIRVNDLGKLSVTLDNYLPIEHAYEDKSVKVEVPDENQVKLLLPELKIEITYTIETYGFTIKLPSYVYDGKLEGLCGNLNSNPYDDFQSAEGRLKNSVVDFGRSWALTDSQCEVTSREDTSCMPPSRDQCLDLFNKNIFGECHSLVDPATYVHSCQLEQCGSNFMDAACLSFAAYAKRCLENGVCLNYRTKKLCHKTCPAGLQYFPCGKTCVKTCDNYELINKDPSSCSISKTDGCYCPDGMVIDNEVCVNESSCITCDSEGHRLGDEWKTDPCTTCNCKADRGVICRTKSCPSEPVCLAGFNLKEVKGDVDDCCGARKECKLIITGNCSEPVAETCDFGKQSQLIDAKGLCPQYVCTCIDPNDCEDPAVTKNRELKPGEKWQLDSKGCCSKYVIACTGICPQPNCPMFYEHVEVESSTDQCCQEFTCEKPKDSCVFEPRFKIVQGLERPVSQNDIVETKLYGLGDKWIDGLCVESECILDNNGVATTTYVKMTCQTADGHPDENDYDLTELANLNQCCPQIVRLSCKVDGFIIDANQTFHDPTDSCRSVECKMNDHGNLEKVEQNFNCNKNCALGWKYEPSPLNSNVCCGQCQKVSCEYEGQIMVVGAKWKSNDNCTHFECIDSDSDNKIRTRSKDVQCEEPTADDRKLYIFEEEKRDNECCANFERKNCIFADGQSMQVGEERKDPNDNCLKIICERSLEKIIKRKEIVEGCSENCPLGHKYIRKENSDDCCGKCLQVECVDKNTVRQVGDTWQKSSDKCYNYKCQMENDVYTVIATKKDCPYFNSNCPKDKILKDSSGCCQICNVTSEEICEPVEIDPKETVGIFVFERNSIGRCQNREAVLGFKKCKGQCSSGTNFELEGSEKKHVSHCNCCQPIEYSEIQVNLTCSSWSGTFPRTFKNIKTCQCHPCTAHESDNQYMNDQEADLTDSIPSKFLDHDLY